MQRPPWWEWDLELTSHLLRRMLDRGFNEVDLREMLEAAHRLQPDVEEGRFIVAMRHDGTAWEVIIEPDRRREVQVVVTAYRVTGHV